MFCPYCGSQIPDGSRFCGACGRPIGDPEGSPQSEPGRPAEPGRSDTNVRAGYGAGPQGRAASPKKKPPVLLFVLIPVALLVVLGIIVGLRSYNRHKMSEISQSEGVLVPPEEAQEEAQAVTPEPGGEAEQAVEPDGDEPEITPQEQAAAAYLNIVKAHESRIKGYTWQNYFAENNYRENQGAAVMKDRRPIGLLDIDGDGIEELIFLETAEDPNAAQYVSDLHIFTCSGDKAVDLYEEALDAQVAGGVYYVLFTVRDENALYLYKSWGDENWDDDYYRYELKDGVLNETCVLQFSTGPTDDYQSTYENYYSDGSEISKVDFAAKKSALIGKMDQVLCYNWIADEEIAAKVNSFGSSTMTYEEAVTHLTDAAGLALDAGTPASVTSPSGDGSTFEEATGGHPLSFYFASGVGGWGTELVLETDGSFTGSYHDSDMGDSRAPNGVCYTSVFSGKFDGLTKVDDFTYEMQLAELETEREPGEEWEEDGVLYIASEPYGLDNPGTFCLYVPGAPTADLPEEFCNWIKMPRAWEEMPPTLDIYGLYNVNAEEGFGAEVDVDEYATEPGAPAGDTTEFGIPTADLLIPDSRSRILTEADIAGFSKDQIQLAINEIYAQKGYNFKTDSIRRYFAAFDWYDPTTDDQEVIARGFTSIEKQNVDFLAAHLPS